MRIAGKLALVTGASSGIGAATAQAMARRGARVILVARDEQRLRVVAQEIAAMGARATIHAADLGDPRAIEVPIGVHEVPPESARWTDRPEATLITEPCGVVRAAIGLTPNDTPSRN